MKSRRFRNFNRTVLVALGTLLAGFGCSGDLKGYRTGSGVVPTEDPESVTWEGFFSGYIDAGSESRYGEALLTADGHIRILFSNMSDSFDPRHSIQFVGRLEIASNAASGAGFLIGQGCTRAGEDRFCGHATPAEITISIATHDRLSGQIMIDTETGQELWDLEMSWPGITYLVPATLPYVAGLYVEELAEYSRGGDTVITVDGNGRIHFQSARSGCVGNGELSPYADGKRNVYSVTLTIEICDAAHSGLNGTYEGLATRAQGDADEWGDWLVVWLVSPLCSESECQALTMWGSRI